uniref:Beta-hexosaminidase n=1 Tax=Trichobilharzia regenti TaxID=157069 RepID=A0AA85IT89_TRIRE|nr:unnamed protein product [Trichobilharzia regenti]
MLITRMLRLSTVCQLYIAYISLYCILYCQALVPKPVRRHSTGIYHHLVEKLTYDNPHGNCYILIDALRRFEQRLLLLRQYPIEKVTLSNKTIDIIKIQINKVCDESHNRLWPSESMNESYSLLILGEKIVIDSEEVWGVLQGLETILQLVYRSPMETNVIEGGTISDAPLYPHRGYLIDSSRHYLSTTEIVKFIDAMAMVKMNVLHWHIVDDQSFPYVSKTFPQLSLKGAFHPHLLVYTPSDVNYILNYARLRGIRVMPEFDTPGHVASWGKGYPEVLTQCYTDQKPNSRLGPVNPVSNYSYKFMSDLYEELLDVFPENLFHLGGDEVEYDCWRSNPSISEFMKKMQFGDDYRHLEGYYIKSLIQIIKDIKPHGQRITPVVWQEIFENGFRGDKSTIVHVWKDTNWQTVMKNATQAGYRVLFSAAWYLNLISYGDDWKNYYLINPRNFGGNKEDEKFVIGGEAAMWGEYVDSTNLFSRSWPRGAAVAERLWTEYDKPDTMEFVSRVEELRCRMLSRGWNPEPINGPGYCPV